MTRTSLFVAAAAAISLAGSTAGFAAELPSYEARGFPISAVLAGLLGGAYIREQAPTTVSPHQPNVLPHKNLTTAKATPGGKEAARVVR